MSSRRTRSKGRSSRRPRAANAESRDNGGNAGDMENRGNQGNQGNKGNKGNKGNTKYKKGKGEIAVDGKSERYSAAVYEGTVMHCRHKGKGFSSARNAFSYKVFMVLLDLDDLQTSFPSWSGFSVSSAFAPASFHRRDYIGDPKEPIAKCVRDVVQRRLGKRPRGRIKLLTNLRYFCYVFNPVSIYYLFAEDDPNVLETAVLEVTNTPWLERRVYVIPLVEGGKPNVFEAAWKKDFHVSPFMDMAHDYWWKLALPSSTISVEARSHRAKSSQKHTTGAAKTKMLSIKDGAKFGPPTFDVALKLRRVPMTKMALLRVISTYPTMTAMAQLYIHWQALKVFVKGISYVPPPSTSPVLGLSDAMFHLFIFTVALVGLIASLPFAVVVLFLAK